MNGNQTRPENVPAIERATKRSWDDWMRVFTEAGATQLPHPEIAQIARAAMPHDLKNPDWWAQGTAIAFEQQSGLRVPGQSSTGDFRVSASRTVSLGRDAAIEAWVATHDGRSDHLGHARGAPRSSRTAKRSFWRFPLEGAGTVEIAAFPKSDDKVTLTVSHTGLVTGDRIEDWRSHWKSLLTEL